MSFPILKSERLYLRQVTNEDADIVLKGYSDSRVNHFMSVSYSSLEEVQVQLKWYEELYAQKTGIWWGICLNDSDEMIGNGGFHLWHQTFRSAELGYWILPEYQGNGYAVEAVQLMLKYGFYKMNLNRIEAIVEQGNQASSHLLAKLGFHLDGVRREAEWVREQFINLEIWSKLNTEESEMI